MNDRLTLVLDGRQWFVQRDATLYSEPIAVRMWWKVRQVLSSAYHPLDVATGSSLTPYPTGCPGADYAGDGFSVVLADGGRTQVCRRWEADVPPPKSARVVEKPYQASRGDVFWSCGQWHKELKARRKPLAVRWDALRWHEVSV